MAVIKCDGRGISAVQCLSATMISLIYMFSYTVDRSLFSSALLSSEVSSVCLIKEDGTSFLFFHSSDMFERVL